MVSLREQLNAELDGLTDQPLEIVLQITRNLKYTLPVELLTPEEAVAIATLPVDPATLIGAWADMTEEEWQEIKALRRPWKLRMLE